MPTASARAFRRATFMAVSSTTYSYLVERLNDFDLVYIHIVEPRIARFAAERERERERVCVATL
jgi:hypothetical protein